MCTNTSPPVSSATNPKPLAGLNHFTVPVLGKRRIPSLVQNLQQVLLDQSIDDARDAELSAPPSGLGISTRLTGCG
jgi:hypothetical protein